MVRSAGLATLLLLAVAAPAAAVEKLPLTVTNDSQRIAECAVLIDGRIKKYVNIRPGKTYTDQFESNRELKLVCEKSRPMWFGPLKLGSAYRIVRTGAWFEIAEAAGD